MTHAHNEYTILVIDRITVYLIELVDRIVRVHETDALPLGVDPLDKNLADLDIRWNRRVRG